MGQMDRLGEGLGIARRTEVLHPPRAGLPHGAPTLGGFGKRGKQTRQPGDLPAFITVTVLAIDNQVPGHARTGGGDDRDPRRQGLVTLLDNHDLPRILSSCGNDQDRVINALRFMLTRLYDWVTTPEGSLVVKKDPDEYIRKMRFHRTVASAREYGLDM